MNKPSFGDELGRQRMCLKQRTVFVRSSEEVKEVDIKRGIRW